MSGPNCISTITSRRIYKKIKAIPSLLFLGHIEVQTTQEGCPIKAHEIRSNANPERLFGSQLVGGSSETESQDEKKPEVRFSFQPIRAKLQAKTPKFSLRKRIFARNS